MKNLLIPLFRMTVVTPNKRYFILSINQPTNLQTQSLFDQGHLIFAAKKDQGMMYIFNTKDEVIPYDFITQDSTIKDFKIEEIQLRTQGESKQLSHLYKFR
ncbi:unnamed protein product [Paramecium primaurelia]|uniref:Uncharacterized protein n=1 Tax=Paramecium primaurelia TaxID=5886 RepID=A0A8S1JNT9_PARPR|nr:unnamed protein product [Paramecium primaurelia]